MNHCSKTIECTISLKIECVHCKSWNYVSQTMDNDPSKFDVEEITCWSCGKDSLVDEELLELYPDYPDESIGGHFEGMREP